jgi:hypothetical protein
MFSCGIRGGGDRPRWGFLFLSFLGEKQKKKQQQEKKNKQEKK